MDYGCDVSNRYTGYLDSSDHGNSMSTSIRKKKGKTKKKRKTPNNKNAPKNLVENIEDTHLDASAVVKENEQVLAHDDASVEEIEHVHIETDSTVCPKSSTSCGSLVHSDTSKDETRDEVNEVNVVQVTPMASYGSTVDGSTVDGTNVNETKWSEICFEEEKKMMTFASQSKNDIETRRSLDLQEDVFNEHRIYPTIYFYNSSFGNRNRRLIDWHDSGRRFNTDMEFYNRNQNHYNSDHGYKSNNSNQNYGTRDDTAPKKKRSYRNTRRRKKSVTTELDGHNVSGETRSSQEQPMPKDFQKESNEVATSAQQTINNTESEKESSNQREINNVKNRYNRLKHGVPPRTFTRRRSDLVRNV